MGKPCAGSYFKNVPRPIPPSAHPGRRLLEEVAPRRCGSAGAACSKDANIHHQPGRGHRQRRAGPGGRDETARPRTLRHRAGRGVTYIRRISRAFLRVTAALTERPPARAIIDVATAPTCCPRASVPSQGAAYQPSGFALRRSRAPARPRTSWMSTSGVCLRTQPLAEDPRADAGWGWAETSCSFDATSEASERAAAHAWATTWPPFTSSAYDSGRPPVPGRPKPGDRGCGPAMSEWTRRRRPDRSAARRARVAPGRRSKRARQLDAAPVRRAVSA